MRRREIIRALLECSLSENGVRMRRWIPRFGWKLSGSYGVRQRNREIGEEDRIL